MCKVHNTYQALQLRPRAMISGICVLTTLLLVSLTGLKEARAQGPSAATQAAPSAAAIKAQLRALDGALETLRPLRSERARLLKRLQRFSRVLASTRAKPAGPARDFKLRRLMAAARALAQKLSRLDGRINAARLALGKVRQQLGASLLWLRGARKALVARALQRTGSRPARRGGRNLRVLKVARVKLDPLDGPREIHEKADLLRDSEEKLRRRIAQIDLVIKGLGRRQQLRSVSRRVDRYTGLWSEDTSRRRVTRLRPGTARSPADGVQGGAPQGAGEPSEPNNTGEMDGDDASLGSGFSGRAGGASDESVFSASSPPTTYAVVLREVLTPGTLAALRKAGQSTDPRVRLAALKRVRAELKRQATGLRQRASGYRQRAKRLKSSETRRRR